MRVRRIIPLVCFLATSLSACDAALRDPQLNLTADSSVVTIPEGCTAHSASLCIGWNYGATYLHLERNGYVGTVTLRSDAQLSEFNPPTLTDTQTVARVVVRDYSTDHVDKTLRFSVNATAPGARDAQIALSANVVWAPSVAIANGKQIGTVVNGIGSVTQDQQATGTVVINRTKFPGPVTLYVSTYATSGSPDYRPRLPNLPAAARAATNPTTDSVVDLLFDATSLPVGTYRVEVGQTQYDFYPLVYLVTVQPKP